MGNLVARAKHREMYESGAKVLDLDDLRVICLEGKPRDVGLQAGEVLGKSLGAAIEESIHILRKIIGNDFVARVVGNYVIPIQTWWRYSGFIPASLQQEITGLAVASGLNESQLLNHFTSYDRIARSGCTAVGLKGDEGCFSGHNTDYLAYNFDANPVVALIKIDGQKPFVSVGPPDLVLCGISTMTQTGKGYLTAHENLVQSSDNGRGMPMFALQRAVSGAESLEMVLAALEKEQKASGGLFILTNGDGVGIVECSAGMESSLRLADEALCANHFENSTLAHYQINVPAAILNSRVRAYRLNQLMGQGDERDAAGILRMLRDQYDLTIGRKASCGNVIWPPFQVCPDADSVNLRFGAQSTEFFDTANGLLGVVPGSRQSSAQGFYQMSFEDLVAFFEDGSDMKIAFVPVTYGVPDLMEAEALHARFKAGVEQLFRGKYRDAENSFGSSVFAESPEIQFYRGVALDGLGRRKEAMLCYTGVITLERNAELKPWSDAARLKLGIPVVGENLDTSMLQIMGVGNIGKEGTMKNPYVRR